MEKLMHIEIGSYDAKTNLSDFLKRVEAGESFTITNRGRPVADLVPSHHKATHSVTSTIAGMLARKKVVMADDTLNDLKNAGRK